MRAPFGKETRTTTRELAPGVTFDRELAARLQQGDRQALSQLLDRHLGPVCGYLTRRLGPGHEELVAAVAGDTFHYALRHMKRYARGTDSTPMRLWLLKIAGGRLTHRQKKEKHTPPANASEPDPLNRLREAMRAIAPRKQAALSLALFEALPAEEIAGATGLSTGRAMRLLRRALHDVRSAVEAQEPSDG